jgi:hypothetical protein
MRDEWGTQIFASGMSGPPAKMNVGFSARQTASLVTIQFLGPNNSGEPLEANQVQVPASLILQEAQTQIDHPWCFYRVLDVCRQGNLAG